VLEGLKSAIAEAGGSGGSVDYDSIISQLGNRVFLLHNVHEDRPVVFQTRWAMSYLSGPMTRPQIKRLMAPRKAAAEPKPSVSPAPASDAVTLPPMAFAKEDLSGGDGTALPYGFTATPPGLDPSVKQLFVPVAIDARAALENYARQTGSMPVVSARQLVYEPVVIGSASVAFSDRKRGINENLRLVVAAVASASMSGAASWDESEKLAAGQEHLSVLPDNRAAAFASLPDNLSTSRNLSACGQPFADWLYYHSRFQLTVHPGSGLFRRSGESEREFSIRLQQAAREKRDQEVDALERKYAPQLERIREKIRREERELAQDEAEHQSRKTSELVGLGESVLGFFLGRKSTRGIGTAITRRRMTSNAKADIEESHDTIAELKKEQETVGAEMQALVHEISAKWEHPEAELTSEELAPRRGDVTVNFVGLGWLPFWRLTIAAPEGLTTVSVPGYELAETIEK